MALASLSVVSAICEQSRNSTLSCWVLLSRLGQWTVRRKASSTSVFFFGVRLGNVSSFRFSKIQQYLPPPPRLPPLPFLPSPRRSLFRSVLFPWSSMTVFFFRAGFWGSSAQICLVGEGGRVQVHFTDSEFRLLPLSQAITIQSRSGATSEALGLCHHGVLQVSTFSEPRQRPTSHMGGASEATKILREVGIAPCQSYEAGGICSPTGARVCSGPRGPRLEANAPWIELQWR